MPQMVADYRRKIYELREKTREKKVKTEEQTYSLAIGKTSQPHWEIFKGEKRKK